jgi:glycosyltransferase involved in cell wall biosynthesis
MAQTRQALRPVLADRANFALLEAVFISPIAPDALATMTTSAALPVFGFMVMGGPINGASVRDIRLANELARRGFPVHLWWVMDRPHARVLDPRIGQHWLFHSFRYAGRGFRELKDRAGRLVSAHYDDAKRAHVLQKRPHLLWSMWRAQLRLVCGGVERQDSAVVRRFARQLSAARVTHLLPALEILCPWAAAAKSLLRSGLKYAVTFQGYELCSNYARELGCEAQFYERIREVVAQSDWPAIAVSQDYIERIALDVGLPAASLVAIPPGVPVSTPMPREQAIRLVREKFPDYLPDVPLVTFVGRRDTEKGIDLLLYAASILRRGGTHFQLCVCGPTVFGSTYGNVCKQIAKELRLDLLAEEAIPDDLRTALFTLSRCVVYPSIHREPFGMVPVEAMAQGTPVVVPDWGGVAGAIQAGNAIGGLHFTAWDSGHLALQISRLLEVEDLHQQLSQAGPRVAEHYSIGRLADRILAHLGIELAAAQRTLDSDHAAA